MAKDVVAGGGLGKRLQPAYLTCKDLAQMKSNPRADWNIRDVERVCDQIGLICKPPSRGSHFKIRSVHVDGILTIPADKPIKTVYIRKLTSLADAHISARRTLDGDHE